MMKIVYQSIFLAVIAGICYASLLPDVEVDGLGQSADIGTGGISITPKNDTVTFGRPECKNCTDYISGHISTYRTALLNYNVTYVLYGKIPPCDVCFMKYVETLNLYGDACMTPVPNQLNKTDTRTNLQWDNITIECQCHFASQNDVLTLLTKVQNLMGSCGNSKTTVDTSIVTDSTTFIATNNALQAFQSCATTSGSTFGPTEPLNITVVWHKLKYFIVVRTDHNIKGPRSSSFVDGGILERNMSAIDVKCASNAIETSTGCNCLVKSRLLPAILVEIGETVIKCAFSDNSPDQQFVYDSYLACNN